MTTTDITVGQQCEHCGRDLNPAKITWLELDTHTGIYHVQGEVAEADSQGLFAFGTACARTVLKNGGRW